MLTFGLKTPPNLCSSNLIFRLYSYERRVLEVLRVKQKIGELIAQVQ